MLVLRGSAGGTFTLAPPVITGVTRLPELLASATSTATARSTLPFHSSGPAMA